ncbi:hypothetical protein D3C72_1050520 [compost metagenome]
MHLESAVSRRQRQRPRGLVGAGLEAVQRARVACRPKVVDRVHPAHRGGLQQRLAAQVGDRARGFIEAGQRRVQAAADPQDDVAATGQRQCAVGHHAARAGHGQRQGLAARVDLAFLVTDGVRSDDAGVAAHVDVQVAAAQGAEAGEAAQFIGLVWRAGGIGAEVQPPCGGLCLAYRRVAAALAPQPVSDQVGGVAGRAGQWPPVRSHGCRHQIAGQADAGTQRHVATAIRIPGAVDALRTAVHKGFEALARVAQHGAVGIDQARLVIGVARVGARG